MSKWNLFLAVLVFTVTTRGGARLNSNTVSESFGNALRRQDRFRKYEQRLFSKLYRFELNYILVQCC